MLVTTNTSDVKHNVPGIAKITHIVIDTVIKTKTKVTRSSVLS